MDKDKEQYYLNIIKRASDRIKGLAAEVSLLKTREPIAVIGLGCRFPGGANSPEAFWKILSGGIDTIGEIPSDRWDKDAYFDGDPDAPGKMYTRFGGFIDRVDWLDTAFFGISPREAESLDPQQRLLMEVSWEALEHAGLNPLSLKGSRTGVFIGICSRDYIQAHLGSGDPTAIDPYSITGVAFSTATGRLSYLYDFRGPSIAVDTACSSSLVSLHLAVQSLINRESDCALAGGVSLMLTPEPFIGFSRLHAISADGRCRSFDEDASGYARGEGCGIVILKRLSDAERDGDIVLAVLKGSAVNQDGESSGLTAPNGLAQQDVILRALESAGINPDEVGYVEAHGTGTKLGDPIECRALGKIFDGRKEKLPIGSVKSNIGHLEAAAGIAGLIKVILALQKGMIPRSLHFNHPNSHIPWNEIPLRVITEALPWERQKAKRIAGVSSFGFSGTNAHVIVVEAPEVEIGLDADNPEKMQAGEDREYILPLSAKTDRALRDLAMLYERYLHDEGAHYPIRDICGTAALCRMHFDHRLCVTGKTHEELRDKLRAYADGGQKEREQHGIPGRYVSGEDVSWTAECPKFRKVPLPTYPFQRERYWRELTRKRETEKISAGQGEDNKYALPCSAAERLPIYPAANESLGDAVLRELKALVFSVSGIPLEELHSEKNLFALGLDSIMLVQMRQAVERKFGVVFTMSQINNELSTLSRLAAYVEVKLPETVPGASLAKEALSPAPGVLQVVSPSPEKSTSAEKKSEAYVPFSSIASRGRLDLNKRQRKHLDDLIARYCTGTAHSKEMTQRYRSVFANVRNIAGFRREWKEMIYQIIVERASGSRIWDIDGREYLDISMGFGVYLFGHNPPFIKEALESACKRGLPIGPMVDSVGRVAGLIHELTGVERVAFFNTGTEAVMSAVRIARTVTRRKKIVVFAGSYHGHFDGVLAVGNAAGGGETVPMVPGTPPGMVQDVLVLNYGDEESLRFIETHGSDLAAVLVEPVQSRRPDLQPSWFLRRLREITLASNTALIFDEVIVGFRIHQGGAQAWFKVVPDIVTYGKIVGGGLPIGVVAGRAQYLDAVDGGAWTYGDDSIPLKENTFIAGTFNHHPLAMAGAEAVLSHLKEAGPGLQERLNSKTAQWAERLNGIFREEELPVRMVHFGSLFRFVLKGDHELLNYHLLARGIYIWEGRNCFVSTAHTDEDLEFLARSVRESVSEMREGGIFPERRNISASAGIPGNLTGGEIFPLSAAQNRMYVLSQLEGGEISYHIPVVFFAEGKLDIEKVERVFRELVTRHECLRTSFEMRGGESVQIVHDSVDFSLEHRADEGGDIDALVREYIKPFDLSVAPLMRLGIVKVSEARHLFILDAHHIIFDGISADILIGEIIRLLTNDTVPLPSARYRDYIAKEQDYIGSERYKRHGDYWVGQFVSGIPALDLPTDYPRPAMKTFRGRRVFYSLDGTKMETLRRLARSHGVSVHMLLFAAHYVLLYKLTGQEDIVVGTTFDGRGDKDLSSVIGMFVNTLPIRNRPAGPKSFVRFLEEVKGSVLGAHDFREYPFEHIVQKCGLQRDMSRNPLFDTMFVYEKRDAGAVAAGSLVFTPHDFSAVTSIFDITHEVTETLNELKISMEYNTDIFCEDSVKRFFSYYENILAAVAENSEVLLSEIDILPESERRHLLEELNDTKADYPKGRSIVDLFEEQVERTPGNTAIVCGGTELTYRTLNEKANRLSHYLREQLGVKPDDLIGLMVDRSEWIVIGILGIMKAGGAYLPIDPSYPEERRAYMIEDSGCRVLLTQWEDSDRKPFGGATKLSVTDIRSVRSDDVSNPAAVLTGGNAAYVIYTSGSTGKPKGCMVTHENVVRLMKNSRHMFDFRNSDVWIMAHSYCFDFSVWEMYGALLYGGKLVIPESEQVRDTAQFLALLKEYRVSVLNQTPGAFYNLMQEELKEKERTLDTHLRYVVFGGDRLELSRLKPWIGRYLPDAIHLINMYGITETTVHVTYCRLTGEDILASNGRSVIGVPLPETTVYLLDKERRLVPGGSVGEIYVGGTGVCRGYLNRPDLTGERFIESPYKNGERLYKTGDLGRWLADGRLEYLGRNDDQVQVRGYRIELGEIESHLLSYENVIESVVIARETEEGRKDLVAYLIHKGSLSVQEVRNYLGLRIPDYMIPAYFVSLERFPLTPNGKIDKKALPDPLAGGKGGLALGIEYCAPRSTGEKALVEVLEAILGRRTIGIHDNYFALGGDSIKAIQVVSRLQQAGLRLEVRDIFRHPTIAELAPKMSVFMRSIDQEPVSGFVPLTPVQSWFFREHAVELHHFNQAILLSAKKELNEDAMRAVFRKIVDHHDALRMRYRRQGGEIVQENEGPVYDPDFEVMDLRNSADAPALIEARVNDVQAGFDPEKGRLMKVVLFRLSDGDRMIIAIHHLVVDAVSWRILLEDIFRGYEQALTGKGIRFPLKTDSFKSWAEMIHAYGNSREVLREIPYWQALSAVRANPLPVDLDPDSNTVGDCNAISIMLTDEETEDLLTKANRAYTTGINDILLTTLARTMKRWHGGNITFITLEGHGRQDAPGRIDISRTVGWFTVLYPVALELPESGDMGDQLKGIKESLRKIPDKGRGYGILKYMPESGNRGALISSPVPQVCFNYLGSLDGAAGNNIFTVEQETVLHTVAPGFRRDHLLDLEGMTLGGKLRLTLTYNRKAHKKETAETLLSWYRDELREIVAHCKGKETQERTPGDLTYSGLSLRELEEVYRMCDLERGNLKDIYPLSPMQEGMLFHTLYESGSTAYFEQLSFALEGVLDTEIFEDSWNELVKRHDIMRTSFAHRIAERPLQVVALERKIEFGFEDISTEDEYRRREHIEEFRQKDRERGFALSRDMLMRVKVFKLSENVFEVIWSHPHILMDGWCYGVIFKELFAFYEALRNAERPELEPVTPYRDYIAWLEEMDRGKSVNYWANYLSGYERAATIPTDMGETNGKRHVLKIENFTIGEDMTSKLRDIAIENQATVNSVIQGIWGVVLSGYNGSDDVVFGAAVSGRPAELPGIESMIGLFLNTVPVRIKTGAAQSFGDLIRHIQKDSISGEAHHYCSIADIQSQSVLKQDLLDHVIVFENYPLEQELSVSGGGDGTALTISSIEIFEHTSYALSIEVTPGKRMSFMVRYNGAAYSAGRIAEVKDRILTLIGAVAEQPEIPVTDLKGLLTSGAEKGEQMDFIHSILEIDEDF